MNNDPLRIFEPGFDNEDARERSVTPASATQPEGEQWVCFHCNTVLTGRAEAEAHFGVGRSVVHMLPYLHQGAGEPECQTHAALPAASVVAREATEEIREWLGLTGRVDGEALSEVAAIISKHFAAVPVEQEWLPIETAPRGIDVLLLWADDHMQIHHFPLVEKPSFWFENAPIKWRHLPPLPNSAATTSSTSETPVEGEAKIDFSCRVCGVQCPSAPDPPGRAVCPEHCEDHDYRYERNERGHYCQHCGQQAPEDWYDD